MEKVLKLDSKGVNAGPYFDVYTSPLGFSYTYLTTVYLPAINSTASVTMGDNIQYVKLVSKGACTNFVIDNIPGTLLGDFSLEFSQLDFS